MDVEYEMITIATIIVVDNNSSLCYHGYNVLYKHFFLSSLRTVYISNFEMLERREYNE